MKITPVIPHEVNQLCELWKGCAINSVTGNYRNYRDFHRAFASYAMQNKDYFRMINFPRIEIKSPPLIFYVNALKIRVLYMFTPKTKDEKAFDIFVKQLKKERKTSIKQSNLIMKALNRMAEVMTSFFKKECKSGELSEVKKVQLVRKSLKQMSKIMSACAKHLS